MVSSSLCPQNCNLRGKCTSSGCVCLPQYGGNACEKECSNNCNNRGTCNHGICECDPLFAAPDCLHRKFNL